MADEGKEFPDEFSPVPTPLTGSERILVEKGTATIDDVKAFARTNLPTPSAASDAATKGYVDARPGAEEWSKHPATQDVDMDGHKITGLGEPTDAADAATKGYVDGAAPAKIEWPWTSGGSNGGRAIEKVGNTGLRMVRQSQYYGTNPDNGNIVEVGIADNNNGPAYLRARADGYMPIGSRVEAHTSYFLAEVTGGVNALGRCKIQGINGMITVQGRDATPFRIMSESYLTLPAGVDAVTHGIHLAKEAYDALAEMPAPPDLEWWEPVWTPVENVDSVSNVECQYTRTYRAAGGSLVTLEGTIEVTPEAGGARSTASVSLPIPRVGTDIIGGVASFTDYDGDDFGIARVGIADLGAGQQLTVQYTPDTDAVHRVSFRLSYRAA